MLTQNTTIGEALSTYPEIVPALLEIGMHCLGCPCAQAETLGEAAMVHGLDVDEFMHKLNDLVSAQAALI